MPSYPERGPTPGRPSAVVAPVNRLALALWICAVAAVTAGSLLPGSALQHFPLIASNDKLEHFLGYLISAALAVLTFRHAAGELAAATALVPLGIALEFAQRLVPGRNYDVRDMLADSAGVAVGLALGWTLRRVRARLPASRSR